MISWLPSVLDLTWFLVQHLSRSERVDADVAAAQAQRKLDAVLALSKKPCSKP